MADIIPFPRGYRRLSDDLVAALAKLGAAIAERDAKLARFGAAIAERGKEKPPEPPSK